MSKVNSLLSERLKTSSDKLSKMSTLAERSSSGNLSSFSGVFKVEGLSEKEKEFLKMLLAEYQKEGQDIEADFDSLSSITSEVKAISNQAAILHGERIKRAQEILKKYKDGAFTFWLIQTYGNRQTPYNFLQYYELYLAVPQLLLPKLDEMPRQAAYTLASREGPFETKVEIIKNYQGETKQAVIEQIRKAFPLQEKDKRAQDHGQNLIKGLQKMLDFFSNQPVKLLPPQQKKALQLIDSLKHLIEKKGLFS
jgi:hypothetical protein